MTHEKVLTAHENARKFFDNSTETNLLQYLFEIRNNYFKDEGQIIIKSFIFI